MGCDIHCYAEKQVEGSWQNMPEVGECFNWRQYGMFGFFADVRNYAAVPPITPRRGLPSDVSEALRKESEDWGNDAHSHSWIAMDELLSFNYDSPMEDRRVTRQIGPNAWDGGCTAEPGEGKPTTYREFLGGEYFKELNRLGTSGVDRIVFWFDN